jgi:hypothetical protein
MNVCGGEDTSTTSMGVYIKEVAEAFGVKVPISKLAKMDVKLEEQKFQ